MRPSQGFWGTGEQGHCRGTNAIFSGEQAVKLGELGNTNSVCNDIKYCYKEPFLEVTQNGMVLVTLVLVWCVSGCFNGPNSGGT